MTPIQYNHAFGLQTKIIFNGKFDSYSPLICRICISNTVFKINLQSRLLGSKWASEFKAHSSLYCKKALWLMNFTSYLTHQAFSSYSYSHTNAPID